MDPAFQRGLFYMKVILILLLFSVVFTECHAQVKDTSKMQRKPLEQVIKENKAMLLAIPGVQGYYQGQLEDGSDCIVIMVDSLTEKNKDEIPDSLDGYPVKAEEGGTIKPLYKRDG